MAKPRVKFEGQPCHYCGSSSETRDHVVPKALGGKNGTYNAVPCCLNCNQEKADEWPTCPCEFCDNARERFATYDDGPDEPRATLGEFSPTFGTALGDAANRLLRQLEGSAA